MRKFLRRSVFANFGYKVVSVAFAIALWWTISHDPKPAVVELAIPIEFQHVPTDLEISSLNIPEAQVRVRGPERVVHELRARDLHVEVNLADAKPGERTFDLTSQQVRLPQELQVMQIVPSQVRLTFDRSATRSVEVRPRVIGSFASGYRMAQVVADPSKVTISGPQQRVEAVEAATTDPVDATGVMNRNTFVTNAYVSDPLVQLVKPAPIHVTVIMEHSAAPTEKP